MTPFKAVISSTFEDLKELRKDVMDACLRQGVFPLMMEHLPASELDAVAESIALVNQADIYVGVIGNKYGFIPDGYDISITEIEYNQAQKNGLPCLIFIKRRRLTEGIKDLTSLQRFVETLEKKHVVQFYESIEEIRYLIINSLAKFRQVDYSSFHNIAKIPPPPNPFIAHPYILLRTEDIVGRKYELQLLDNWVSKNNLTDNATMFCFVAIGGMGKSCITWKWFVEEKFSGNREFKGKIWWSFYESDATFENFIIRTLAYIKRASPEAVASMTVSEREEELIYYLNNTPFLICLDGLERILIAYAQLDAAKKSEDELDALTSNKLSNLDNPSEKNIRYKYYLRKAINPRIGVFLKRLSQVVSSKILISSRLIPADLQDKFGKLIPGVNVEFLTGLQDEDAINLWRKYDVSGDRKYLVSLFNSFENYPLLIRSLAGEVSNYRPAPGNLEVWREHNENFNPFNESLISKRSHVLSYSFRGLSRFERNTLIIIAAFRMPCTYDTLVAVLIEQNRIVLNEQILDATLSKLEDRGLIGWDRQVNRYDLHPIVRGVIWNNLAEPAKLLAYKYIQTHFESLPIFSFDEITIDDLSPVIELYNSLVGQNEYNKAFELFSSYLDHITQFKFNASLLRIELLEALIVEGKPALQSSYVSNFYLGLGYSYLFIGNLEKALSCMQKYEGVDTTSYGNLTNIYRLLGDLTEASKYASEGLALNAKDPFIMGFWGWILAARGDDSAVEVLEAALKGNKDKKRLDFVALNYVYLSRYYCWNESYSKALEFAQQSLVYAKKVNFHRDEIRANRALGYVFLNTKKLNKAEEHLLNALNLARGNMLDEEILALIGLAELNFKKKAYGNVRELAQQAEGLIERGSYMIYKAELLLLLGELELVEGSVEQAISHFSEALELSKNRNRGIVFYWGYKKALRRLEEIDGK